MRDVLSPWANPVTYGVPFFLLAIAIELAALKWLDRGDGSAVARGGAPSSTPRKNRYAGYAGKDATTSLLMGAGSLISISAVKAAGFVVYIVLYTHVAPWHLSMRAWWAWALALTGVDLAYYWYHRFTHRVRVGWAAHQAHHSSEYMNFGTALRQKWNPWFDFFFWLPLPLLGVPPWALYVCYGFNLVYQFFVHTELVKKLPRAIELVFNTPSHHRVHHGSDPIYLDRNYGGILIVWDRMFGTFQAELHRPTYGLTHPVGTYNLIKLQYGDYAALWRDVRSASSWRDRLGYVFMPPRWEPASAPIITNNVAMGSQLCVVPCSTRTTRPSGRPCGNSSTPRSRRTTPSGMRPASSPASSTTSWPSSGCSALRSLRSTAAPGSPPSSTPRSRPRSWRWRA
jgi:sterol desaturase/sphingolipid hydroxylase (fatty acid hydroxylase superfamily)